MQKVVDLMITDLITIKETDSLATAKELMADKNIRNLPVVDESGKCLGMLTQREYLKHAFYLVSQCGTQQLSKKEAQTPVKNAMNTDILTLAPETDLDIAAQFFISNKYGSLPVVEDDKLIGILTPVDFVKLAHNFLKDQ